MYGFGSSTRRQVSKVFVSVQHAKLSATADSPGPSTYTLAPAVGQQSSSRKHSAPQWAFGSADRFTYGSRDLPNPGPGAYTLGQSVGSQVSSSKQSQPIYGFGSAGREHVAKVFVTRHHYKALYGTNSPGPAVYTLNVAVGKQELTGKRNQPNWGFGSGGRFQYDDVKRAASSPGPGAYMLEQSLGSQVSSMKPSSPIRGFGTSNRDQMNKLFISHQHEKVAVGNNSPGPGNYTVQEATGRQASSKNTTAASWGFGTCERFGGNPNRNRKSTPGGSITPGPGAYVV